MVFLPFSLSSVMPPVMYQKPPSSTNRTLTVPAIPMKKLAMYEIKSGSIQRLRRPDSMAHPKASFWSFLSASVI